MRVLIVNVFIIILFSDIQTVSSLDSSSFADKCTQQVYQQCQHRTTFTAKEIQTTQLYLRKRFSVTNPVRAACPINPLKPPCIRKDIKCLSQSERKRLTDAWLKLYSNGVIGNFTKIHNDYWGAEHKFAEAVRWHFWFINRLEKELQKIDPSICMPYWNTQKDFAHPEKSIVWEIFGHAGNQSNDYCVPDGPFANIQCTFPSPHCLRRQWRFNPRLDPWKGLEYATMVTQLLFNDYVMNVTTDIQTAQTTPEMEQTIGNLLKYIDIINNVSLTPYPQRTLFQALEAHFDTHLAVGGFNGDMSVPMAPNDPIFHIFHIYAELTDLLWQLSNFDDYYLEPKSYNADVKYRNISATISFADIDTDRFEYYSDTYAKESFQFGYGEMCHLYDVIIEPINDLVNQNLLFERRHPLISRSSTCVPNQLPPILPLPLIATLPNKVRPPCNPPTLPIAAQRIKNCLSPSLFELYYPKFANNKWTFFDHLFTDISANCNPVSNTCRKMPFAVPFNATLEGQRQYNAFNASIAGYDITGFADVAQEFYVQFMNDMNACYCSPYV